MSQPTVSVTLLTTDLQRAVCDPPPHLSLTHGLALRNNPRHRLWRPLFCHSPSFPERARYLAYHPFYKTLVGSGIDRLGGADGLIFSREARWSKQNRLPLKSTSKVSISGVEGISILVSIQDAPKAPAALANGGEDRGYMFISMCV